MSLAGSYERNIRLYKYYVIFSQALFIWPIEILFLSTKGLSYTQIMLIESLASIIQLVLEIPSGIIADAIGCKKTVLLGLILEIIAYIVLIFANGFEICIVYGLIMAGGCAMMSGADSALIYESHLAINRKDDYRQTIQQSGFLKMITLSFVTILSGFLYQKNIYLPHALSIGFLMLSVCVIAMYKDVDTKPDGDAKQGIKEYAGNLMKVFLRNKSMCWLLAVALLFQLLFSDTNYFLQIYMKEVQLEVNFYGPIFFICNVISAISFKNSKKIDAFFGNKTKMVSAVNLLLIYAISAILYNFIGIGVLCLVRIWIATISPLLNASINEKLPTASRATLLSIYAALVSIFVAVFDPIMGFIMDKYGIRGAFVGVIILCAILMILLSMEKNLGLKKLK